MIGRPCSGTPRDKPISRHHTSPQILYPGLPYTSPHVVNVTRAPPSPHVVNVTPRAPRRAVRPHGVGCCAAFAQGERVQQHHLKKEHQKEYQSRQQCELPICKHEGKKIGQERQTSPMPQHQPFRKSIPRCMSEWKGVCLIQQQW